MVDSVDARRVAHGTLDAFLRGELEFGAVHAPDSNLTEHHSGLATRAGSRHVVLVGREEFDVLSDEAVERVEHFGVVGGSQRNGDFSYRNSTTFGMSSWGGGMSVRRIFVWSLQWILSRVRTTDFVLLLGKSNGSID